MSRHPDPGAPSAARRRAAGTPWGRIKAIDLNVGKIAWQVPNGDAPEYVKNHPVFVAEFELPANQTGLPMTYMHQGRSSWWR